jgi:hypothetical protein
VQASPGDEYHVTGADGESLLAAQELQLTGKQVEDLVFAGVGVRYRPAARRHRRLDEPQRAIGELRSEPCYQA